VKGWLFRINSANCSIPSRKEEGMDLLREIAQSLIQAKVQQTGKLIEKALSGVLEAESILKDALLQGMTVVGDKFKKNEIYIPEVMVSAKAMKMGMEILKPFLVGKETDSLGLAAIGTVSGDLHDIGKNLVCMMLEGVGFDVIDLGIDVPTEKFVQVVKDRRADVLGLSALLSTTMPSIEHVIRALEEASLRDKVKVMVGGAPVTQEYADQVKADGYAPNAGAAAEMAKELLAHL
jgi:5-methyltetrahydrofolate--homocysteine methyltransferase